MNEIATRSSGFALQPHSMNEAMQAAEMLSASQMVPRCYQGKPQDTLVAMMMGSELGLNPIQSLQNIAVINGKPSIYGDALLALVQNHKAFGGHEESFDESTMIATCTVWRKGDKQKHAVTFSKRDAELAALWGKQGPWKQYPKRMLMWRARGYALRDKFADALGGLITVEEAQDIAAAEHDTPREPASKELPPYPAENFARNLTKWQEVIKSGQRTADEIVAMVQTKGTLTESQKSDIRGEVTDAEFTETDAQEQAA